MNFLLPRYDQRGGIITYNFSSSELGAKDGARTHNQWIMSPLL